MRLRALLGAVLVGAAVVVAVSSSRGQQAEPDEESRNLPRNYLADVLFLTPERGWAVGGAGTVE